jgi:uncharacterized protein (TIGR02145 family)
MKHKNRILVTPFLLMAVVLMLTVTCKKEDALPVLITTDAISIAQTTATSGGNITSDGGASVTARGVCWGTVTNPSTALTTKTTDGTGTGSFPSSITGLTANTTYYVRAYATNSAGTAYGNEVSFTTLPSASYTVNDNDGNTYNTITIGTQVWLVENLKTTKYNDGTAITYPETDNTAWTNNTTGAYAWYGNDAATYKATYGALYNWYAVDHASNGGKSICPAGWHVPRDAEWTTLTTFLGGETVAGGKMKSTGTIEAGTGKWYDPNTGADNSSGFSALPGGSRGYDGTFSGIGNVAGWWSSTAGGATSAWFRYLDYEGSDAGSSNDSKTNGFSVRCIRD